MKEFKPPEIDWSKIDYHVYEEPNTEFDYLVRIVGDYSRQEFLIPGEQLDAFMLNINMTNADVFVYKMVQSYEQME